MIKRLDYEDNDFKLLCKYLDDVHIELVAEQRSKGADCTKKLEKFDYVYVYYLDDSPVGCLAMTSPKGGVIEIGRVFVSKKYRNKGIATKLFEEAEKQAKILNAKKLILDTYERLSDAVRLYKKLGFYQVEQFENLKHSPFSICMEKKI